jgi:hypothetical protein
MTMLTDPFVYFGELDARTQELLRHYKMNDGFDGADFLSFDLNRWLRENRQLDAIWMERLQLLDAAIRGNQCETGGLLYRGTSAEDIQLFIQGDTLSYPAYLSISFGLAAAVRFLRSSSGDPALLRITCSAGTPMPAMEGITGADGSEKEFLLGRNTILTINANRRLTEREQIADELSPFSPWGIDTLVVYEVTI